LPQEIYNLFRLGLGFGRKNAKNVRLAWVWIAAKMRKNRKIFPSLVST